MRGLIIWGATGQAKVLLEFVSRLGFEVVAFVDNNAEVPSPAGNLPVLHGLAALDEFLGRDRTGVEAGIAAIGGLRGRDRLRINSLLRARGLIIPVLVHPAANLAGNASVGPGSQILVGTSVCAEARLGEAVIVNTGASVDHECVLGDGVHVAPGATLAGCVTVGAGSFIGPGAVIASRVKIGEDVVVGAGSVVLHDLADGVRAYGIPARPVSGPSDTAADGGLSLK